MKKKIFVVVSDGGGDVLAFTCFGKVKRFLLGECYEDERSVVRGAKSPEDLGEVCEGLEMVVYETTIQ